MCAKGVTAGHGSWYGLWSSVTVTIAANICTNPLLPGTGFYPNRSVVKSSVLLTFRDILIQTSTWRWGALSKLDAFLSPCVFKQLQVSWVVLIFVLLAKHLEDLREEEKAFSEFLALLKKGVCGLVFKENVYQGRRLWKHLGRVYLKVLKIRAVLTGIELQLRTIPQLYWSSSHRILAKTPTKQKRCLHRWQIKSLSSQPRVTLCVRGKEFLRISIKVTFFLWWVGVGKERECVTIHHSSRLISTQELSTLNDKEFHCCQREIAADLRPLFGK